MKKRKIKDYRVIKSNDNYRFNFSSDIIDRIDTCKESLQFYKKQKENNEYDIKRFEYFQTQFELIQNLKEGVEYKVLSKDKEDEWKKHYHGKVFGEYGYSGNDDWNIGEFRHPLMKKKYYNEKKAFSSQARDITEDYNFAIKYIQDCLNAIEKKLNWLNQKLKDNSNSILELEAELNLLQSDYDNGNNNELHEGFENKILQMINIGYVPLGGICIKYDTAYQAMVKYSEEL